MLTVAAITTAAATVDALTVGTVLADEQAWLDSGGDVLVVEVQDDASAWRPARAASGIDVGAGGLDAGTCARLADVTGVVAGAAVSQVTDVRVGGRPDAAQTVFAATSGLATVLGAPMPAADEVLVAKTIGERWGVAAGSHVRLLGGSQHLPTGALTVTAVRPLDRLGEEWSTALVVARAATGPADSCYLRVRAAYRDDLRAALPALLGETADRHVQVRDVVSAPSLDAPTQIARRSTRLAGVGAGLLAGGILAIVGWTRRSRAALYASLGVPYAGGVLLRAVETLIPLLAGAAWGCLWAMTVTTTAGYGPTVAAIALRHGAATALVGAAVAVLASLRPPGTLVALKER